MKKTASKTEKAVSLVILGTLLAVAGGVFFTRYQTKPALEVWTAVPPLSRPSGATSTDRSSEPSRLHPPEELVPLTPPEIFDANTLSDKINGKAELYLSAGFIKLESRRYAEGEGPDRWLESYVYDMGNFKNAFSVFSLQRRENATGPGPGPLSYAVENGVFFVHGRYYVEIVASTASSGSLDRARALGESFIGRMPVADKTMDEAALFPAEGLIAGSIALLSSNAFGCEFLDQVFTATYRTEGKELTVFLSKRKDREAAAQLADIYHRFLMDNGGKEMPGPADIAGARLVEILEAYELVFSRGLYFAGIHDCADSASAAAIARLLDAKLRETADGS